MYVDMIFTDYSFQDGSVFGVTDLHYIRVRHRCCISPAQYGVPIFRDPDEMNGHTRDCMTIISLMVAHCSIIPSTENLALKCIVYD